MKPSTIFLPIVLSAVSAVVFADVYKWTDESGRTHFSDKPVNGAKKVDLPEPSVYSPVPVKKPVSKASSSNTKSKNKDEEAFSYSKLAIISPENNSASHNNEGIVPVHIEIDPPLQAGHVMALSVDGEESATELTSTSLLLKDMDRGTHTLQVKVMDENKNILNESKNISFTLHKISVNKPATQAGAK